MNKDLLKEMREAALELPVLHYSIKQNKYPVNHFRRMKKIYQEISKQSGHDEGYHAILDYCTQVIYLKKKQDEN